MSLASAFSYGWSDVSDAYARRVLWWNLAREDISDSFSRTLLGPIWILLSYTIFVYAIYVVLDNKDATFLAYIAVGLLVWNFIAEVLGGAASLFFREGAFVRGTTLPLSIYAFRLTGRSAIRLGYALFPALLIVFLATGGTGPIILSSLAGLLLLVIAAPAVTLVIAILGAFMPDIEFVIQNAIRILFFLSPVFWHPSGDNLRQVLRGINPITYYIDVVRTPIADGVVSGSSWMVATAMTAAFWVVALYLLGRYRDRIVFAI